MNTLKWSDKITFIILHIILNYTILYYIIYLCIILYIILYLLVLYLLVLYLLTISYHRSKGDSCALVLSSPDDSGTVIDSGCESQASVNIT